LANRYCMTHRAHVLGQRIDVGRGRLGGAELRTAEMRGQLYRSDAAHCERRMEMFYGTIDCCENCDAGKRRTWLVSCKHRSSSRCKTVVVKAYALMLRTYCMVSPAPQWRNPQEARYYLVKARSADRSQGGVARCGGGGAVGGNVDVGHGPLQAAR
jgi:hypothetical protein